RAILARLRPSHTDRLRRWSLPVTLGSLAWNDSTTALRQAAPSHYLLTAITPRFVPRAEPRHRCAPPFPNNVSRHKWLRLHARNWLCFFARYHEANCFGASPVGSVNFIGLLKT